MVNTAVNTFKFNSVIKLMPVAVAIVRGKTKSKGHAECLCLSDTAALMAAAPRSPARPAAQRVQRQPCSVHVQRALCTCSFKRAAMAGRPARAHNMAAAASGVAVAAQPHQVRTGEGAAAASRTCSSSGAGAARSKMAAAPPVA